MFFRPTPRQSSASCRVFLADGNFRQMSAAIPRYCAPWPGNTKALLMFFPMKTSTGICNQAVWSEASSSVTIVPAGSCPWSPALLRAGLDIKQTLPLENIPQNTGKRFKQDSSTAALISAIDAYMNLSFPRGAKRTCIASILHLVQILYIQVFFFIYSLGNLSFL